METCPLCEKQAKNKAGLMAHMRIKHPEPAVVDHSPPVAVKDRINYHLPPGPTKARSIRTVKMVAPLCKPCTDGLHAPDWFNRCPHDPYFHDQEMPEVDEVKEYQDDGTYIVRDRKTVFRILRFPNLRQVPHSPRHLGVNPRKQFNKGWILPEQVGIAPFCQALDCYSQDIPDKWVSEEGRGMYCSAAHALPQLAQEVNVILETGNEGSARRKRQEQLAKLNFR